MMHRYRSVFIAGTDSHVGKTVFAAILCHAWQATYWKPVEWRRPHSSDRQQVASWIGVNSVLDEAYLLKRPSLSHQKNASAVKKVDLETIRLPTTEGPLVVEGTGGVLTPLDGEHLMIDLMLRLALPIILVAKDSADTINQTLLALERLRVGNLRVLGVALMGSASMDNRQAIEHFGSAPVIAQIPPLVVLNKKTIAAATKLLPSALVDMDDDILLDGVP